MFLIKKEEIISYSASLKGNFPKHCVPYTDWKFTYIYQVDKSKFLNEIANQCHFLYRVGILMMFLNKTNDKNPLTKNCEVSTWR